MREPARADLKRVKGAVVREWFDGVVKANEIEIHYHRTGGVEGNGRPVLVLLHGITDNGLCWARFARGLEDSYDLVMPDARGHGQTCGPVEGISYGLLATDLAAFVHALGLDKPFLVGHSMGAMTAMRAAANSPDLARALVLEDPPLLDLRPEAMINENVRAGQENKKESREERIARVRAENPAWVEEEIQPWAASKEQYDPEVFRLNFDEPWRDILARIECPFLLVTGDPERGAIVTPDQAAESVRLAGHGGIARIIGAGHCIHRDRFSESMKAVRAFLAAMSRDL